MATFQDLLTLDIVYYKIFPYVSLHDLLNFRSATEEYEPLVDGYFSKIEYVDWDDASPALLEVLSKTTRKLKDLNLPPGMNIDNGTLRSIIERNKDLSCIHMRSCCLITQRGVHPIAHLRHLTCLTLRENGWADDHFVERLVKHLRSNLTSIDLSMCPVTDSSLMNFFKKFKGIKNIDLDNMPLMTDRTLYAIGYYNNGLENISLVGNKQLCEMAVREVVETSPNIRSIALTGCTMVSAEYRRSIQNILLYE